VTGEQCIDGDDEEQPQGRGEVQRPVIAAAARSLLGGEEVVRLGRAHGRTLASPAISDPRR